MKYYRHSVTSSGAEGRFDLYHRQHRKRSLGIVDYAHTPDALLNVLHYQEPA